MAIQYIWSFYFPTGLLQFKPLHGISVVARTAPFCSAVFQIVDYFDLHGVAKGHPGLFIVIKTAVQLPLRQSVLTVYFSRKRRENSITAGTRIF